MNQTELDKLNAEYWNEPCGIKLAQRTNTVDDFEAFDREYFRLYPFLPKYLDKFRKQFVLEVGVGYGTIGTYLKNIGCRYEGTDIAREPCMMLVRRGLFALRCNIFDLPKSSFMYGGVVSIGCLHHTGDIPKSINIVNQMLKPGGRALIMLYNADAEKLAVDINTKGERAPHIEYTKVEDVPTLFKDWSEITVNLENGAQKDIYIEAIK